MAEADLTALGKYDIVRPLGRGAMGIVYEGFDPIITRRVAVKTVRLDRVDDAEGAEDLLRFKREAQAAGRLTHPNIVGVYDYGETTELAYIVMEFVEGDTLKSLLDRGERFTPADAVAMVESLLAGLAYSHQHGVIHRDIKPANVMITRAGQVKLADFGVARIESSSLTQAGTMIGTPSYMSPEQFMGQTIDARTDIYSTGAMLYQLLTGEKPFEGSVTAIMHKVLNTEPPPPSALSVSVSPALDGVIARAMAKRPEDRFTTARDFAASLRDAAVTADADATMITPARPTPPQTKANPIPAARGSKTLPLAGLGILIAAGIAAYALLAPSHPKPKIVVTALPTPAALRHQLAAALAPITCALPHATLTAAGAAITGIASGPARGAISQAASAALTPLPATTTIHSFTGPYCGAIDAIRPAVPLFHPATGRLGLHLAGGATRLVKGQHIVVDLTMPAWPAHVAVDYITSAGDIYRLYPSPTMPETLQPPGATLTLGLPPGQQFAVGPPYGRDMILAIASTTPITTLPRPQATKLAQFLAALQTTMTRLETPGTKIAAGALLLDTAQQ